MDNPIPRNDADLVQYATGAVVGLVKLQDAIGLVHNKAVVVQPEIDAVTDAILQCGKAQKELTARNKVVRSLVTTSLILLRLGREGARRTLGGKYSQAWDVTGFIGSLALPKSILGVQKLLVAFAKFLRDNPELEIKDVTADRLDALATDIKEARGRVRDQKKVVKDAFADRNAKSKVLRKRMRDLIGELTMKLGAFDTRWLQFGFNMPGADATPDAPQRVTVTLIGPTAAAVKWPTAPRAKYYRIYKQVVGVDAEMVAVGSAADHDFTIESLPVSSTVNVAVSAVNDAGESGRSEVVVIVMPGDGAPK